MVRKVILLCAGRYFDWKGRLNFMIAISALKRQAREAIKQDPYTALMITFLALLPSLLSQTASTIAVLPLSDMRQQWYASFQNTGALPDMTQLAAVMGQKQLILLAVSLLIGLIRPMMELGWIACLMRFLRLDVPKVSDVLCRKKCFFKVIWLTILYDLKILLWMLPGYVAFAVLYVLAVVYNLEFLLILAIVCIAVSVVLGIRAALHYNMAAYVLADCPEKPVLECFRESVRIMRHRKMAYVLMMASFLGWILLLLLVTELVSGISYVVGIMVQLLLSVPLNLYRSTTACAFYEEC